MRTFDFAPLYRSTVGFDRLFDRLDSSVRPDWPPYNIERFGEDAYRITMAIAGFRAEDVELTQQGNTLIVTGRKDAAEPEGQQMLHKGIAFRNFTQTFNLIDHVKVLDARLADGLLAIELVREVPEQLKPRRIQISSASGETPSKQIEQANAA